jgi:hypothetical protein
MSLVPDDLPRDPGRLLQQLQQMTEVIAALLWPSVTRPRPRSKSCGC